MLWVNHRGALIALGGTDREFYGTIWRDMGRFIARLRADLAVAKAARRSPVVSSEKVEATGTFAG
jgi:hypothetical protein